MSEIAVYGKGGIGRSTISSDLSVALSEREYKVMQIGCDSKADPTIQLHQGHTAISILGIIRARGGKAGPDELVTEGSRDVFCAEAGGPTPDIGCAGHGIITAFEALEGGNAFEVYKPGMVIYNMPGGVVYGGFAMPTQEGCADKVFIVVSGKSIAIYTATNIAAAVKSFEARGYVSLGGILLNYRGVKREQEKVEELAKDMGMEIIGSLNYSPPVGEVKRLGETVVEAHPDSDTTRQYRKTTDVVLATRGEEKVKKAYAQETA